jgi:hypothetical protein
MPDGEARLTVLVSSSVYGKEPMLEQIFATLEGFGYKVWMSLKGTVPVIPGKSAFESCLIAVENCDLFFGLITSNYGSGTPGEGEPAITHRELIRAIELEKPRFMLAHDNVVLARRLLMDLDYKTADDRKALKLRKGAAIVDDLRLIDMYEAATREDLPIAERTDNWVQPYKTPADALRYVEEQFSRYGDNEKFVAEWRAKKGAAQ